jgi:AraC-like DNA-binding protein
MRSIRPNRSPRTPPKSARLAANQRHLSSHPDALGVATRLAAKRLREAGISLEPLLRSAGLSVGQVDEQDTRIGVASQIKFLELAAEALKDQLLGFGLARDGDLRLIGLLYYAAASSETLGDALARVQRYSSIANSGIAIRCFRSGKFTIALRYAGVTRHSDRQQHMEFLVTVLIRVCRVLTDRRLAPTAVRFIHRRSERSSEMEKFFGCAIEFGADTDEIVFQDTVGHLHLVGADPYLSQILMQNCDQALAHRRPNTSSLRVTIENAITFLLPDGKARLAAVAKKLGMSSRTLERKMAAERLSFSKILNQLRSDLATHYLSDADLSISQIAWLVGYQGIGAFSHSYKRWTGLNPKKMRERLTASH